MAKPQIWEDGAAIVGMSYFDLWNDEEALNFPDEHAALDFIEQQIYELRELYFTAGQPQPDHEEETAVSHLFANIGAAAFDGYVIAGKALPSEAMKHILLTLCSKQAMYGHKNIAGFGIPGIIIRCWDKVQRLHNLEKHDGPVLFEPELDSWLDITGYAILAMMWLNGWFMLDLKTVALVQN